VQALPFTSEGYNRAKSILQYRYGKQSEIINQILPSRFSTKQIFDLLKIPDVNVERIHFEKLLSGKLLNIRRQDFPPKGCVYCTEKSHKSAECIKVSSVSERPYLNLIFNLSLSEGKFPIDWKKARVSPIFKSGNREECGNYRPISILSVISKIFEKIVFDQLSQYLITNKILTDYQSGFRKGYSTCSSLLRTTNEWLVNMDKGLINGVVFLDLKKAFDTVDQNILIKKLELYGLKNNALRWFISYLSHRKQICKVGMSVSNSENITAGVPQRYLGPLLL
jgi:hypothetical protein